MKKVENSIAVSFKFIPVTFILLVSIVGCSDTPYTGSMLTPDDVDKYITRPDENKICLENEIDSVCLELTRPQIHIYGKRIVYTFYYEDAVLLQAERQDGVPKTRDDNVNGDTDANVDGDTDANVNGDTDADVDGDTHDTPIGWNISVYYQDGRPANAAPSLEESGYTITVLDDTGTDITDDVSGVALVSTGDRDTLQFFVPSPAERITIRVAGLIDQVTTFIVDTEGNMNSG